MKDCFTYSFDLEDEDLHIDEWYWQTNGRFFCHQTIANTISNSSVGVTKRISEKAYMSAMETTNNW